MKKGIYYYTTEEHLKKIECQNYLDKQIALELLSNFTSFTTDENGFTSVSARKLQGITHEYKRYISFFVNSHIIYVDNNYIEGEKTRGYKLREEKHSPVVKIEIENITFLKQKIAFFNSEKEKFRLKETKDQFKKMKSYFTEFVRGIDIDKAFSIVQQFEDINARIQQYKLIDKIKENRLYFKRNKTNFRLDTNLTNLKSNIKFCNEGEFTQIDISNSQPFFMSLIINSIYYSHNVSRNTPIDIDKQAVKVWEFCEKELKEADKKEIEKFNSWVISGLFYDNFVTEKLTRKEAKKIMMCVLFSKPSSYLKEKKVFAAEFPAINKWVNAFKTKNGYNQFAIMLQRMESHKVLDVICNDLTAQDIFNVTVHDSWIIKNEDLDRALVIIKSHFTTVPNFKFESFATTQTATDGNEYNFEYKEEETKIEITKEMVFTYCIGRGIIATSNSLEKIKETIKNEFPDYVLKDPKLFEYKVSNGAMV